MENFKAVTYEECKWEINPDALALMSKTRRRKVAPTYQAAIPATIAESIFEIPAELTLRLSELSAEMARFDASQANKDYSLPSLLLRSESSSSSQIENLTSSVKNVALAELSHKAPANAVLIAANVAAMRAAIGTTEAINKETICQIHKVLMNEKGGAFREEQVWIGGNSFSPHGAKFIPPHASRVNECLDDLLKFAQREDIHPLVKIALFHAQFETIHPFTDGNGRTGRALLHCLLAQEEILTSSTLPISAGLLHNVNEYMTAIQEYQKGNYLPIVEQVANAFEIALVLARKTVKDLDIISLRWSEAVTERTGSAIHRLASVLIEQPVVNTAYLAKALDISDRAARSLVDKACEYGMLQKMGNAKRGAFYFAPELIEVMEFASSSDSIQRIYVG